MMALFEIINTICFPFRTLTCFRLLSSFFCFSANLDFLFFSFEIGIFTSILLDLLDGYFFKKRHLTHSLFFSEMVLQYFDLNTPALSNVAERRDEKLTFLNLSLGMPEQICRSLKSFINCEIS
jgi:hypothetical protein